MKSFAFNRLTAKIGQIYYQKGEKETLISSLTANIELGTFADAFSTFQTIQQTKPFCLN